ncbi:Eco57I restriction-modification methylase domain-containing protein [Sinanaerobacter chloroacetimidivorans]|uniref:site-specific DNA-methyltransferase (adenine-specific) n=1 Tax=Sinanaerobacter chloroacetimidivorans TaxID=2818044 RepID=A0A8J8B037_9FIRM|nr:N-6 DNA methylase [Sinanaerobacter chloroacetimidivorans]MBR0596452.1 N-6 DNA methylase [Sinanaerobacter chloroacetimidivorans]
MSLALNTNSEHRNWEYFKNQIENMQKQNIFESEEETIAFSRTFCYSVVSYLWKSVDYKNRWKCRTVSFFKKELDFQAIKLSKEVAEYFITLNLMEYAYLLGNLYTMLLPKSFRSNNGVYYTPPMLAERLLDLLSAEGADWAQATILDPACGGGAFLITVANRMLGDYRVKELSAADKLIHLESHLAGIEIDTFAGWLTQVLLDIIVYPESVLVGRRLKTVVKVQDTLQYALRETKKFDIIVGNPPYGRIKLDEETRKIYSRSLYGHANLYGLFIDASLRLKKRKGLVGFVTPTSFLGGRYFANLRDLLASTVPPLAIDFVALRAGVFDQVLQETCLVVFGKNTAKSVVANKISIENNQSCVERIGVFKIEPGVAPWVIAREPSEATIINEINKTHTTLADYGYKVSTGQLVWNRLKGQISSKVRSGLKPIIWAEAISQDGQFCFDYHYRKKLKYIKVTDKQNYLICNQPVVLVQRTTAKEQSRRLQTCVLPSEFVKQWDGVVVENHVNIIYPIIEKPAVSLDVLSLILNSLTVDRIFRCLSGSVAVSATELHAIPLPPIGKLDELISSVYAGEQTEERIEEIIKRAYGLRG